MLNPDGVVFGNHRCSMLGVDLNRRWLLPSAALHPTVHRTKKLVRAVNEEREVAIFADLHGHFRKRDAFMYCCSVINEGAILYDGRTKNAFLRAMPLLLS